MLKKLTRIFLSLFWLFVIAIITYSIIKSQVPSLSSNSPNSLALVSKLSASVCITIVLGVLVWAILQKKK